MDPWSGWLTAEFHFGNCWRLSPILGESRWLVSMGVRQAGTWDLGPGTLCCSVCTRTNISSSNNKIKLLVIAVQSCLTLCDPTDCSTPSVSVLHCLLEFSQTNVHWVSDAIQPSHSVIHFSFCLQSLPESGSFPMSQLFISGGQHTGVSASTSVLPMNISLGLTGLISLQAKGQSSLLQHN